MTTRRHTYRFGTLAGVLLLALAGPVQAQLAFEDASEQASIATSGRGHGVAVYDVDGDGWDDLYFSVVDGRSTLFRNNQDGTFTDAGEALGVALSGSYSVALFEDLDGDGRVDLFVGQAAEGASRLFRQRPDGTFEDVSAASGLRLEAEVGTATLADYDGDGAADLFLAVDRGPDLLYRNTAATGPAWFEDVSARAGIGGLETAVPMQATWHDVDRDGDVDLFCVHDAREPSRLYLNPGYLPLQNNALNARIDTYPNDTVCCNMGIAWGDYDGDGWEDAYVTRIGAAGLYHNNGDGTFTDVAAEVGADRNGMAWGTVFADLDRDGDLDLFVGNTTGFDGLPTLLYRNDGGTFTEQAQAAGAALYLDSRGVATGDFDRDGWLDLVMTSELGDHRLLMNRTEAPGRGLLVDLRRPGKTAIGTRVEVTAGGQTHVRTRTAGDSYAAQQRATLHVGLGEVDRVETLRIQWPGGAEEVYEDLAADAHYVFTEGVRAVAHAAPERPPAAFQLAGHYPEPFASRVTIRYTLPQAAPVRLVVYDLLGREVAVLANRLQPAGRHTAAWDAAAAPPGLYLYRLTAGSHHASGLMTLLP